MSMTKEELITKITKEWADKGKLLEGGWQAYLATGIHPKATDLQKGEMRKAYFLGAQHLFASIMQTLDPGTEGTEGDMRRMDLIFQELQDFVVTLTPDAPPSQN